MTEQQKYTKSFANLHTAKVKGQKAPHKAILLLAIIDLVEKGFIVSSHIELSEELVECFNKTWECYLGKSSSFTPDIAKPFFHMQHESFWKLVDYEEACTMMVAEDSPWMNEEKVKKSLPKGSYSLKAMRQTFAYAKIDDALISLFKDVKFRNTLRAILVNDYIAKQTEKIMPDLSILLMALPILALVA